MDKTLKRDGSGPLVSKIAKVTLTFWIAKVVATTLGETAGDFIAQTLGLGYAVGFFITTALLIVVLVAQIGVRYYHPALFWAAIVGTTTAGTEISDLMDKGFNAGPIFGTAVLLAGLLISLGIWYARKKTINVYPLIDKDSEILFWIAVVFSNSLGTSFGDWLVDPIGMSYVQGALVCIAVIIVVLGLHYFTKVNEALLFWAAFIFTRPFGATFGNFLTKPLAKGGLELGTLQTSLVAVALVAVIVYVGGRLESRQGARSADAR